MCLSTWIFSFCTNKNHFYATSYCMCSPRLLRRHFSCYTLLSWLLPRLCPNNEPLDLHMNETLLIYMPILWLIYCLWQRCRIAPTKAWFWFSAEEVTLKEAVQGREREWDAANPHFLENEKISRKGYKISKHCTQCSILHSANPCTAVSIVYVILLTLAPHSPCCTLCMPCYMFYYWLLHMPWCR